MQVAIIVILLCVFSGIYAQDAAPVCQGTLDALISQLNGTGNTPIRGESGPQGSQSSACACACASGASWQHQGPPRPIHIDMGALLQASVQQEVKQQSEQIIFRMGLANKESDQSKYYNRANLNMVRIGNKSYYLSRKQQLSWMEAVSFCRMFDMDLASAESREEDYALIQYLRSQGYGTDTRPVFLSANKIGTPGWRWLPMGTPFTHTNWAQGQPSAPDTEHCLVYWRHAWADSSCTGMAFFICETSDS